MTAWQGIARAESQKAYDTALAKYKEQFQYQDITEEHALYTAYKAAVDASLQDFKVLCLSGIAVLYCTPLSLHAMSM